ncbi:MAG TPA: ABC transporter ATP-binding protein [Candidatus Saccharimonadales bacterium]|jgi:ATP-binding cassette subfamily B protein|nr:ABC transporter ATP-binding protein [Candidatus Saccharimonadales bacterium]
MSDERPPERPVGLGMGRGAGRPGMIAFGTDRAKNFKGTIKQLFKYLRPYWVRLAVVFVFAIISTSFMIAGPRILGNMTNDVVDGYVAQHTGTQILSKLPKGTNLPTDINGKQLLTLLPINDLRKIPVAEKTAIAHAIYTDGHPKFNFHSIANLAILLIIIYVVSAGFSYGQSWLMTDMVQQLTYRFRRDIANKIDHLPLKYFDSLPYGEILSRVTNDVDTVGQNLNQSLTQIITSIVMVLGVIGMMFTISWQLALIALTMIPISLGASMLIIKRSQGYFMGQQDSLGQLNGHVEEMLSGHVVMRAFNGEQRSISIFHRLNNKLYGNAFRSQFLSGLLMPITQFVGNLGFVGVAVGGGWLAIQGTVSIGGIQSFLLYINMLNQPITQAANVANVLQLAAAAAERVFDFLGEEEEPLDPENYKVIDEVKGAVDFNHVNFGYIRGKTIIKDFTAEIKPGQRVAIVGPTGAGKTTMVNLLMRFYDVNGGYIKIDGIDIRDMRRTDVRKIFGMVLQDTWLFNGSVKDNIAYGKENATMEEIVDAAKAAHADGFIRALPRSYEMILDEEAGNLAQGEKQLITIARAMLADPPMLILDEATSSVDTRTEVLIQSAMERLMKGRTSFVIAHRLSTIRNADLILVMRDGNIVEHGTHNKLLAHNGFYASLYNSQFTEAIDYMQDT